MVGGCWRDILAGETIICGVKTCASYCFVQSMITHGFLSMIGIAYEQTSMDIEEPWGSLRKWITFPQIQCMCGVLLVHTMTITDILVWYLEQRPTSLAAVSKPSLPSLTTYPMVGVCWSIDEFLMVIPMKITINECYPTKWTQKMTGDPLELCFFLIPGGDSGAAFVEVDALAEKLQIDPPSSGWLSSGCCRLPNKLWGGS